MPDLVGTTALACRLPLPGLRPDPSEEWDWVSAAARAPGVDAARLLAAALASADVEDATADGGLVRVRVRRSALEAALEEPVAVPEPVAACPDVPAAFAAATGRDARHFAARSVANPAYAAVVARDRAHRGHPMPLSRTLLVLLADHPLALGRRPHEVVAWLGATAREATSRGPAAARSRVAARLAGTMTAALHQLGVPDIGRV